MRDFSNCEIGAWSVLVLAMSRQSQLSLPDPLRKIVAVIVTFFYFARKCALDKLACSSSAYAPTHISSLHLGFGNIRSVTLP